MIEQLRPIVKQSSTVKHHDERIINQQRSTLISRTKQYKTIVETYLPTRGKAKKVPESCVAVSQGVAAPRARNRIAPIWDVQAVATSARAWQCPMLPTKFDGCGKIVNLKVMVKSC